MPVAIPSPFPATTSPSTAPHLIQAPLVLAKSVGQAQPCTKPWRYLPGHPGRRTPCRSAPARDRLSARGGGGGGVHAWGDPPTLPALQTPLHSCRGTVLRWAGIRSRHRGLLGGPGVPAWRDPLPWGMMPLRGPGWSLAPGDARVPPGSGWGGGMQGVRRSPQSSWWSSSPWSGRRGRRRS